MLMIFHGFYLQGEIDQYVIFDNDCYEINGCTDFNAVNFNSNASVDDGSCIFIYGCTDISALNYNDNAGIEDGSCLYAEDQFVILYHLVYL